MPAQTRPDGSVVALSNIARLQRIFSLNFYYRARYIYPARTSLRNTIYFDDFLGVDLAALIFCCVVAVAVVVAPCSKCPATLTACGGSWRPCSSSTTSSMKSDVESASPWSDCFMVARATCSKMVSSLAFCTIVLSTVERSSMRVLVVFMVVLVVM